MTDAGPHPGPAGSRLRSLLGLRVRGPARALTWFLVLAGCALGYFTNYLSGPFLDHGAVFLIPCIVAGWFLGMHAGVFTVGISAALWFAATVQQEPAPATWAVAINAVSRFVVFFLLVAMLAHVRKLMLRLSELSLTDSLTGLANRRAFRERGQRDLDLAGRTHTATSLVFIDLDNFKEVNDGLGHAAGDEVLRNVAAILQRVVRRTDFAARLGGDEFALLLVGSDAASAHQVAEKISASLAAEFRALALPVTLSIGIATAGPREASFDELLAAGDRAMYGAKRVGKGTIIQGPLQYCPPGPAR